jgi:protein-S-isoprenylcysteine O-methyltransferase Ste14
MGICFALYSSIYLIITGPSVAAPYEAGGAFSISGPYRFMRNPFMLGIVITLWGEAIYFERLSLIIYAFLFTWAVHAWVVFFEEPALRRSLKASYTEYHKAVPRWFPKFKGY